MSESFQKFVSRTNKIPAIMALSTEAFETDGAHHKQWFFDQIVRVVKGDFYNDWVVDYNQRHEDAPWDVGIAP